MNTPLDNHQELRHAEYVLGVLDADARAEVEREVQSDPEAAVAVRWWQQRLTPLSEEIAASAPPAYVWARIQEALGHTANVATAPARAPVPRQSLWNNLALWRGWGIAASLVAIACLVLLFAIPHPTGQTAAQARYMVASIQSTRGAPGWSATMDVTHARMIVAPAGKVAVPADRSAELWLIPPGGKPVAVGVLPGGDQPAVMTLSADLVARLGPQVVLAISLEPPGGSPTGQPTGPVIAKGAISAAGHPSNRASG